MCDMPTPLDNYNCLIETGLVLTKKLYVQGQWYLMLKLKSPLQKKETTGPVVHYVKVDVITSEQGIYRTSGTLC
jgi:hypothetical protein